MYNLNIQVEEVKPGVLAISAKPVTDQNTTDEEKDMGDTINGVVTKVIQAISGTYGASELATLPPGLLDKALQDLKDKWLDNPDVGDHHNRR